MAMRESVTAGDALTSFLFETGEEAVDFYWTEYVR